MPATTSSRIAQLALVAALVVLAMTGCARRTTTTGLKQKSAAGNEP